MTNYRISSSNKDIDFSVVFDFISTSYWSPGIPVNILKKAIENSLCFSVFSKVNDQVGFARVITDKATFAYLADVFILEEHRGQGLSHLLMRHIVEHSDLQGLRRFLLATRDAHDVYKSFGFSAVANPQTFMEVWEPNVYKQ